VDVATLAGRDPAERCEQVREEVIAMHLRICDAELRGQACGLPKGGTHEA
jgi:hypothetical protein